MQKEETPPFLASRDMFASLVEALVPTDSTQEEKIFGFEIVNKAIPQKALKAVELYENCQDKEAAELMFDAYKHLRNSQVTYLRNALKYGVGKDYQTLYERAEEANALSQTIDLLNQAKNLLGEFSALMNVQINFNIEAAAQAHNRVHQKLDEIEPEINRRIKVLGEERAEEEKRLSEQERQERREKELEQRRERRRLENSSFTSQIRQFA